MSLVLSVALDAGPISRVEAQVAVVALFQSDRSLRGSAGNADWRLCGALSELLRDGRIRGVEGEAVLLPGGGGMRAPLVMALGVGDPERFEDDAEAQRGLAAEAVGRARDLDAASVALPFPVAGLTEGALRERTRALLEGASGVLDRDSGELQLRLVTPRSDLPRAEAALRAARPRIPHSVELRIPEAGVRRRSSQLGATV